MFTPVNNLKKQKDRKTERQKDRKTENIMIKETDRQTDREL